MSITPQDLFSWAQKECPTVNKCGMRASISRAYYSAFYVAQEFHTRLPAPGLMPPQEKGMHATLAYRLLNPAPEVKQDKLRHQSKKLGRNITALHALRVDADYAISVDISSGDVTEAHTLAEMIVHGQG